MCVFPKWPQNWHCVVFLTFLSLTTLVNGGEGPVEIETEDITNDFFEDQSDINSEWQQIKYCPPGTVVTGYKFAFAENLDPALTPGEFIQGVALQCSKLGKLLNYLVPVKVIVDGIVPTRGAWEFTSNKNYAVGFVFQKWRAGVGGSVKSFAGVWRFAFNEERPPPANWLKFPLDSIERGREATFCPEHYGVCGFSVLRNEQLNIITKLKLICCYHCIPEEAQLVIYDFTNNGITDVLHTVNKRIGVKAGQNEHIGRTKQVGGTANTGAVVEGGGGQTSGSRSRRSTYKDLFLRQGGGGGGAPPSGGPPSPGGESPAPPRPGGSGGGSQTSPPAAAGGGGSSGGSPPAAAGGGQGGASNFNVRAMFEARLGGTGTKGWSWDETSWSLWNEDFDETDTLMCKALHRCVLKQLVGKCGKLEFNTPSFDFTSYPIRFGPLPHEQQSSASSSSSRLPMGGLLGNIFGGSNDKDTDKPPSGRTNQMMQQQDNNNNQRNNRESWILAENLTFAQRSGIFDPPKICPPGTFVTGQQLRFNPTRGLSFTGINLKCSRRNLEGKFEPVAILKSGTGFEKMWYNGKGPAVGCTFIQFSRDGLNWKQNFEIRFQGEEDMYHPVPMGTENLMRTEVRCGKNGAICGMKTMFDVERRGEMTDISFKCCHTCEPKQKMIVLESFTNLGFTDTEQNVRRTIGTARTSAPPPGGAASSAPGTMNGGSSLPTSVSMSMPMAAVTEDDLNIDPADLEAQFMAQFSNNSTNNSTNNGTGTTTDDSTFNWSEMPSSFWTTREDQMMTYPCKARHRCTYKQLVGLCADVEIRTPFTVRESVPLDVSENRNLTNGSGMVPKFTSQNSSNEATKMKAPTSNLNSINQMMENSINQMMPHSVNSMMQNSINQMMQNSVNRIIQNSMNSIMPNSMHLMMPNSFNQLTPMTAAADHNSLNGELTQMLKMAPPPPSSAQILKNTMMKMAVQLATLQKIQSQQQKQQNVNKSQTSPPPPQNQLDVGQSTKLKNEGHDLWIIVDNLTFSQPSKVWRQPDKICPPGSIVTAVQMRKNIGYIFGGFNLQCSMVIGDDYGGGSSKFDPISELSIGKGNVTKWYDPNSAAVGFTFLQYWWKGTRWKAKWEFRFDHDVDYLKPPEGAKNVSRSEVRCPKHFAICGVRTMLDQEGKGQITKLSLKCCYHCTPHQKFVVLTAFTNRGDTSVDQMVKVVMGSRAIDQEENGVHDNDNVVTMTMTNPKFLQAAFTHKFSTHRNQSKMPPFNWLETSHSLWTISNSAAATKKEDSRILRLDCKMGHFCTYKQLIGVCGVIEIKSPYVVRENVLVDQKNDDGPPGLKLVENGPSIVKMVDEGPPVPKMDQDGPQKLKMEDPEPSYKKSVTMTTTTQAPPTRLDTSTTAVTVDKRIITKNNNSVDPDGQKFSSREKNLKKPKTRPIHRKKGGEIWILADDLTAGVEGSGVWTPAKLCPPGSIVTAEQFTTWSEPFRSRDEDKIELLTGLNLQCSTVNEKEEFVPVKILTSGHGNESTHWYDAKAAAIGFVQMDYELGGRIRKAHWAIRYKHGENQSTNEREAFLQIPDRAGQILKTQIACPEENHAICGMQTMFSKDRKGILTSIMFKCCYFCVAQEKMVVLDSFTNLGDEISVQDIDWVVGSPPSNKIDPIDPHWLKEMFASRFSIGSTYRRWFNWGETSISLFTRQKTKTTKYNCEAHHFCTFKQLVGFCGDRVEVHTPYTLKQSFSLDDHHQQEEDAPSSTKMAANIIDNMSKGNSSGIKNDKFSTEIPLTMPSKRKI